jgi:hypothetical protein
MASRKGTGRYARYWYLIKSNPAEPLVLEVLARDVKVIKKLISREKEKDVGWQLACQEFKNDLWLLTSSTQAIAGTDRQLLTLTLKRRPLSI